MTFQYVPRYPEINYLGVIDQSGVNNYQQSWFGMSLASRAA